MKIMHFKCNYFVTLLVISGSCKSCSTVYSMDILNCVACWRHLCNYFSKQLVLLFLENDEKGKKNNLCWMRELSQRNQSFTETWVLDFVSGNYQEHLSNCITMSWQPLTMPSKWHCRLSKSICELLFVLFLLNRFWHRIYSQIFVNWSLFSFMYLSSGS